MKTRSVAVLVVACIGIIGMGNSGCENSYSTQQADQEKILMEATAQTGMPAIKNFRERKMMKMILEMRDQADLVTYTYLENLTPTIVKGFTSKGGKLTFLGQTIGYGLPYATQYTNPSKWVAQGATLPQADPNGLFSPNSAEGTWILMANPTNPSEVKPVYIEPRIVTLPWQLPLD